jgi:putative ABC transport system substrate-binding protein
MTRAVTEVRRREVIKLLGGVMAYPLLGSSAARAQQPMPVIGFLRSVSLAGAADLIAAFREGLKEAGFVEGQNVTVELRSAEGQSDRLPALAAELIRRPVAVLVANSPAALVAKAATTTVPIVFLTGGDPVRDGLVGSLNRPGGNLTGVNFFNDVLGPKRLALLRQLAPKATTIGVLLNPNAPNAESERSDAESAASAIGLQLVILSVRNDGELETAFATFVQRGAGAVFTGSGAFFTLNRERLVARAARHGLPAIYGQREDVVIGGLMSYGPSIKDAYHQAGLYTGRILKGEKPADLPVMRSDKFEFVLNLKTAKALGLEIPATLLALADEVIE